MKKLRIIQISFVVFFILGFTLPGFPGSVSIKVDNVEGVQEIEIGGGKSNVGITSGCIEGSGKGKSDKRQISSFNSVLIDGAFDVNIEMQKKEGVEVAGDDNIIPNITTKVSGNKLIVSSNKSICPKQKLEVNISAPDIEQVRMEGSSDIIITGVNNKSLTVELDGSGDINVSGKTKKFAAIVSGSGNIHAKDLHAEDVRISISGSGDADVYATSKLDGAIEGSGDIAYYGNPGEVSKKIDGSGDIEKKD